jgi:EAL domain-containing protein (putative c-di-GMP-specific phosphodiesterase class I)
LLRNADAAMYYSKKKGHNTFSHYSHGLNENLHEKLRLTGMLRRGLEKKEFVVYYQPQLDVTSGQILGFEALLRWQPTDGPMIFPDKFIPLLEETGMIVPVGEWVLEEVCRQVKRWREGGMIFKHASINVSLRQFHRPDIVDRILAIIEKTAIDPSGICLELTESIMMDNFTENLEKLKKLRAAGLAISIDDFGTGYSSLQYLRQMHIDELKIDRSFIMSLSENATLVNTILGMAHNLGLRVVAEGVETEEQRDYLTAHHCEILQGYLLSRPLPLEQFEIFIQSYRQS